MNLTKYYRRIIDEVPSAVIVADKNLNVRLTNPAFQNLFSSYEGYGDLGAATRCAANRKCSECKGCSLFDVFEDAFCSNTKLSRRVYQKVVSDGSVKDITYPITVSPLGGGLCMGAIDGAVEAEIAMELQSARKIQQKLLPIGHWAGGKRYSYMYIPCRDIGGDLPDIYTLGDSVFGVIADVSGKGISAGMLSAFVKAGYDKTCPSPAKAIQILNDKFANLKLDERNYVTVAAVRIDKSSITYSMAGHNVPILLKTASGITHITLNSPPVSSWFEDPKFFEDVIEYKSGDILVLLTDGVTECKSPEGDMFGIDRAIKTLSVSKTADDFINNLKENLHEFGKNFDDDITAIAFEL